MRFAGAMRAGFSLDIIEGSGVQGKLVCQSSFTQIVSSTNSSGELDGCSGVIRSTGRITPVTGSSSAIMTPHHLSN